MLMFFRQLLEQDHRHDVRTNLFPVYDEPRSGRRVQHWARYPSQSIWIVSTELDLLPFPASVMILGGLRHNAWQARHQSLVRDGGQGCEWVDGIETRDI